MVKASFIPAALALLLLAAPLSARAADIASPAAKPAGQSLVVAELYTSQGCNSCPPADALLMKLATRPDVLALGFHVDYWDYLGWKDGLALHDATLRQQAYSDALGGRYVYTPEMVIDGRASAVGSDRAAVDGAIAKAEARKDKLALTLERGANGAVTLHVPAATGAAKPDAGNPAVLWLVRYAPMERVAIHGGENAGKTIAYANVVREIRAIATWSGAAATVTIRPADLKAAGNYAVLIQAGHSGPILAARKLPTPPGS